MTIKEVAEKWDITPKRVQVLGMSGKIEGVAKFGGEWAIPMAAERSVDKRVTTGKYKNWRKKTRKGLGMTQYVLLICYNVYCNLGGYQWTKS